MDLDKLPPYRLDRRPLAWFGALFVLPVTVFFLWVGYTELRAQGAPSGTVGQAPIVTVPGSPAAPPAASVPTQPAVAVTEVKSPAAPAHYQDQAIWALMVSMLLQYLKKAGWFPWLTDQSSARVKAWFGGVAAFLTAAGIHFAVSGSLLDDGGASITITGFSIGAVKDFLWQWAAQQGWYKLAVKE